MEKNMLIAFCLNFLFSVFEFIGSIFTGSVAIASDAVHDMGDAVTIGISLLFERKSRKHPDEAYTYGYRRYSVLAGIFSTVVLLIGSLFVIYRAVDRIFSPAPIHYNGMIGFAIVGVLVNGCAAFFTREGDSVNQKAVNLHMLEDVLGWAVVLIGALVMKFTDFPLLDPLLSIGVAGFILFHALKNLKRAIDLFLEKTPRGISPAQIVEQLSQLDGVLEVHHLHLRSIDGETHSATMHVVTEGDFAQIKKSVRETLSSCGISHVTLELETPREHCPDKHCTVAEQKHCHHHHHH